MKQTRNHILQRSAIFKQIKQDLDELLLLFKHLNEIVRRQELTITDIESNAGRAANDYTNAAATLTDIVEQARKIRKWKWYALTIMSKSYHYIYLGGYSCSFF
jgi:syntaxin 1B/2/3